MSRFPSASKLPLNDKYLVGEEIGKGAYGKQEIDLLKNLNHKNIVKYQGSFKANSYLYIILEYVESGSLASMVKPNKFGAFPESLVAVYISQVLEGLVYLHEQGVIHRDIKGANILITKQTIYEHHPWPKQLILENDLPVKLQKLIVERKEGEHSGGQVLVKQMATSLLKALHINTVL